MEDYSVYQQETLRLGVEVDETGADTAELVAISENSSFTSSASFDGLTAELSTNIAADQAPGDYEYYIIITYDDNTTDILAKPNGCDGDECEKPVITVCELDTVGS